MREVINSVGIDIGTSTTQLIFSKITIENLASSYTVPRIEIVEAEVIYKSKIYFTPLQADGNVDREAVKAIVADEYRRAGIKPEQLQTGAVIITGESARQENADQVLKVLSDMAGDFVVASAGPDLESVLAAKGAKTDVLSKEQRSTLANIDIGGGTSNIAVFNRAQLLATACLDIGGRLIRIDQGKISYLYHKIKAFAQQIGYPLNVGDDVDLPKLRAICAGLAKQLAMSVGLIERDAMHDKLYTNDGEPLFADIAIDGLTFSGGVADMIYYGLPDDIFQYQDVGPLLAEAINKEQAFAKIKRHQAAETMRATVVGAGMHTTDVSGSTIRYEPNCLPLKNIPVVKISSEEEEDLSQLPSLLRERIEIFSNRNKNECVAIALSGVKYITFDAIQALAKAIVEGIKNYDDAAVPLVVIVEKDIAKVLGNALKIMLLKHNRKVICIDSIVLKEGDYVDIGEPIAMGRVVPVITKTLIFNR